MLAEYTLHPYRKYTETKTHEESNIVHPEWGCGLFVFCIKRETGRILHCTLYTMEEELLDISLGLCYGAVMPQSKV